MRFIPNGKQGKCVYARVAAGEVRAQHLPDVITKRGFFRSDDIGHQIVWFAIKQRIVLSRNGAVESLGDCRAQGQVTVRFNL